MPQPIRVQCGLVFNGLRDRPQHATELGKIVATSGRLEAYLGWILAFFSGGSAIITTAMFHAVSSTDAQRAMLQAAAQRKLMSSELEMFNDLMDDFRTRYGERSRLVHNLWGTSDAYPDKAIWCKSSDAAQFMASAAASETHAALPPPTSLSLKCLTYTVQDLTDVVTRLEAYTERVGGFVVELMSQHPILFSPPTSEQNVQPAGG